MGDTVGHGPGCPCRRCVGFTAGNDDGRRFEGGNFASLRHGAHSERLLKPVATTQKRRFLRQNGLRKSDLDGIGLALLDTLTRAQAKVEILDEHFARSGLLDDDGKPAPALGIYFTALNLTTKTLRVLNEHLRQRAEVDPFDALNNHIIEMRTERDGS